MYGSSKCYKHKEIILDDYSGLEQKEAKSVIQDTLSSQILFNIDGKDFSMPSKNVDELIQKISKAKQFWTIEIGLSSNEFIQYAIDNKELEHWNDSKLVESTVMGHERALSTVKEKITDPNMTTGLWWKEDGEESETEDTRSSDFYWNLFAIPVAIFFVFLFLISFTYNSGVLGFIDNIPGDLCCYGLMAIGGMGASMRRTEEGRFE